MKYNFDELISRRGTHCYKWDEPEEEGVIPLWVADMDFRVAPAIQQAVEKRVAQGIFGYTLVPKCYYEAVASWFQRRHQWAIDPSWIQYTSGVVPAISAIIKALTVSGDGVIVQTPVYNCFFSSIRNNGCTVVENPLHYANGCYTMDYADLERKCADDRVKILLLCNPHNPAGRRWSREELIHLNDICLRHGVKVLSDEIHCELTYDGQRYVPFAGISQACLDQAIVCCSPSKSFNIAGLQIANIICNDSAIRQRIDRAININEVCDVNPFGIEALMSAYNGSEDWLDELCDYLYGNYEVLCQFFEQHFPQLHVCPLEATYLVWVDIRQMGMGSDALTERLLRDAKVMVSSGTLYGTEAGEGFIRINIACPRSRLLEALNRMKPVLACQ